MNEKLLKLLQKYPKAKIYPFTYFEVVCDGHGYWLGEIKKVYYGEFYEYDEMIFFNKKDLDEYILENNFCQELKTNKGIIILINV